MDILHTFNNRELAYIILGTVGFILLLFQRQTRIAVSGIVKAFFQTSILVVLLVMFLYTGLVVWGFYEIDYWEFDLAKDTVFWFVGAVVVFARDIGKIIEKERYFKQKLAENVSLIIVLEFIIGLFTFSLWLELACIPILFFLGAASAVAGTREEWKPTKKLFDFILGVFSLCIIAWALFNVFSDLESFATIDNLRAFALPPLLSVAFLPCLYFLGLYAAYEKLFTLVDIWIEKRNPELALFTKRKILAVCHLDLGRLIREPQRAYESKKN